MPRYSCSFNSGIRNSRYSAHGGVPKNHRGNLEIRVAQAFASRFEHFSYPEPSRNFPSAIRTLAFDAVIYETRYPINDAAS